MENFTDNSVPPVTNAQNSDNSVVISPKVLLYAISEKFGENTTLLSQAPPPIRGTQMQAMPSVSPRCAAKIFCTWSKPRNITSGTKPAGVVMLAT